MPYRKAFVRVEIDETMRARAQREVAARQIHRTRASPFDTYVGILGELVWAKWRYGATEQFDTLGTRGKSDDGDCEIKTSKTRVSEYSHLMVREDYAQKRQPKCYVLVLISSEQALNAETEAFVCGWATHADVVAKPPRERISNHTGRSQGYRCYEIRAADLKPMSSLIAHLSSG
ncbi:MAG: hypothetical protein KIH69_017015 [Anaerolineae bacterium]|nr:hypothetical protein [Anaerolineae bacterium]